MPRISPSGKHGGGRGQAAPSPFDRPARQLGIVLAAGGLVVVAASLYVLRFRDDPRGPIEARLADQTDLDNVFTCQTLGFAGGTEANANCRAILSRAEEQFLWRRADAFAALTGGTPDVPLPARRDRADR